MLTVIRNSLIAAMLLSAGTLFADEIPAHPRDLEFEPYDFQLPHPDKYRHELENGVVVFMAPSSELPLIDVTFTFYGGTYLSAPGEEGLYSTMGSMLRTGGTTSVPADDVDDKFDFWAAQVGSSADQYFINATMNSLKSNFDEVFALFVDMVRNPAFQTDKLAILKEQIMEGLKQRNDSADGILAREWGALMYGRDHFKGRAPTKASIDGISVDDLKTAHSRLIHPGGLVIAVTGDFEPQAMLARLSKLMVGWEKKERPPIAPNSTATLKPGVYHVEKDINQGKINIGMRGVRLGHPDHVAIQVMDQILGAGSFSSRITKRVRKDEGLAYSVWSRMIPGTYFPGEFRANLSTKSSTVALASKIIEEEFSKIRTELVSEEELSVAKNALIESFPSQWGSEAQRCSMFMMDEMRGRPYEYWETFRDKVQGVTAEQLRDVAARHLDPAKMAIMVVGKWDDIVGGDLDGRASMKDLHDGNVTHLPLRDPLTLEPIDAP